MAPTRQETFDSLQQEVYLGLWRTYDRLRMLEDELFDQFSLTAQQYNCLRLLKSASPDSIPTLALAGRLVSRAPDITRMIDKLAKQGLVERVTVAENRRTVGVKITATGKKLLGKIVRPLTLCHQRQLGHLSAAELQQMQALLEKARAPHEPLDSMWRA
jgi:DNA-binding MarR family transcriptional regulator